MSAQQRESYLGDGLYARDDGFMIWLRAPRGNVDHEVALEDSVLDELFRFIEQKRSVKITVVRAEGRKS